MIAGAIIVNFAKHHRRAFHEIEHIEWPFMMLFFVLAGATLEISQLANVGLLGSAYIVLRIVARLGGGLVAGKLAQMPPVQTFWIGPALLPQAGVAIGMALVASDHFPELRETILTVTIATTVFFRNSWPAPDPGCIPPDCRFLTAQSQGGRFTSATSPAPTPESALVFHSQRKPPQLQL